MSTPVPAAAQQTVAVTLEELRDMERSFFQDENGRFSTTQRIFFECLLSEPDMDVAKAAQKSGIGPAKAKKWVASPHVRTAINYLLEQRISRLGIDRDALLRRMVKLLDMATGDEEVVKAAYDPVLGGFISQRLKITDLGAAARFTDQLGKHFNVFAPDGSEGTVVILNMDLGGDQPPKLVDVSATVNGNQLAAQAGDLDDFLDADDATPAPGNLAALGLDLSGGDDAVVEDSDIDLDALLEC